MKGELNEHLQGYETLQQLTNIPLTQFVNLNQEVEFFASGRTTEIAGLSQ